MTLQEAQTLAAKITPRRLARALSVTSIAFCKAHDQHGRLRRYAVVGSSTTQGACYIVTAAEGCECKGYQQRNYCRHHDAVLLALDARAKSGAGASAPTLATCEDCGVVVDSGC